MDLNIVRVHLQEGFKFIKLADRAMIFTPFFMVSTIFRLLAISLILVYGSFWITLPTLSILFVANLVYVVRIETKAGLFGLY